MRATLLRPLTLASVLALLLVDGSAIAQTRPAPDAKAWVQRHDKNGDGKIDRGEFQEAVVEAFFFRDKDKSGYLTIVELEGASPEAIKAASRKGEGRLTLQEFVNAVFKDFEAIDTDHDGLLTVEEIEIYIRSSR